MSEPVAQVKIKLAVDNGAKDEVEKAGAEARKEMSGFESVLRGGFERIGSMASEFVVSKASEAFHALAAMPGEAFEAWAESEAQVRQLAGALATIDQNANSYDAIKEFSTDIKDNLEQIAMTAGTTDDALVAVFDNIISRGGRTVDQAMELTEAMSEAGRVIPGGAAALSEGFEAIQIGMIKAKNPVVGLIAASGELKGSAKEVAKQLQGMGIEKAMEVAERAVSKMANKAKDIPATLEQSKAALGVFKGNIFEGMGQPIYDVMTDAANSFRSKLMDADGNATELGQKVLDAGEGFGRFVADSLSGATDFFEGAMDGFYKTSSGIVSAWQKAFSDGDESFESWKMAGETIATSLGKATASVLESVGAMKKGLRDTQADAQTKIGGVPVVGGLMSGALGLFQGGIFGNTKGAVQDRADETLAAARKTNGGEDTKALHDQYIRDAVTGLGMAMEDAERNFANAVSWRTATTKSVGEAEAAAMKGDAQAYVKAYLEASQAHDDAAMTNIAKFMAANKEIATAMAWAGPNLLGEAKDTFLSSLTKAGDKADVDFLKRSWRPDLGVAGKSPQVNFNGNTFNIKQDFKDQDPDRIAVVFRNDVASHAAARVQSRVTPPLGF